MKFLSRLLCSAVLLTWAGFVMGETISHCLSSDSDRQILKITFSLKQGETLYQDFLSFSSDRPDIKITSWQADQQPQTYFDAHFQATQQGWSNAVTFSLDLQQQKTDATSTIHVNYLVSSNKNPQELTIPVNVGTTRQEPSCSVLQTIDKQTPVKKADFLSAEEKSTSLKARIGNALRAVMKSIATVLVSWKNKTSALVMGSNSSLLRFLFIFLLGLLMSFTPCIYPMIPITMGILQAAEGSKRSSIFHNFLLASSYTAGMSTTFALLGLLTVSFSMQFGELLGNPLFVIVLVGFLAYMAFSLFGFYELYIPKFMRPRNHTVKGGSFISAFVFGLASGAFASPCLSPGLALVLGIVAGLNSMLHGLALLFVFGIGSSLPLLIIGTFSNSISLLPRAGMWMVEVKKIFGLMLVGMCFYYLRIIIPATILWWFLGGFLLILAIYYLATIKPRMGKLVRRFNYLLGLALMICALFSLIQGYKEMYQSCELSPEKTIWLTNYQEARTLATAEGKRLFIDFGATWCSLCTAIEKHVLAKEAVQLALENYIPVHIDCTQSNDHVCADLQKKFVGIGLPTLVIVNPATEEIITRWGAELLDMPLEQVVQELQRYVR